MQEKSLIKKNILQFIDKKNITKYQFYKETGITRGILDQNNGMSEENTARFIAVFPEVNLEWLITGRGAMFRNKNAKTLENEQDEQKNNSDTERISELKETIALQRDVIVFLKEKVEQYNLQK